MPRDHWSEWSDNDPAIRRAREAMALRPVQEPLERPERADPVPARGQGHSKAEQVSALIARIRSGDLSAVELLRKLVG